MLLADIIMIDIVASNLSFKMNYILGNIVYHGDFELVVNEAQTYLMIIIITCLQYIELLTNLLDLFNKEIRKCHYIKFKRSS